MKLLSPWLFNLRPSWLQIILHKREIRMGEAKILLFKCISLMCMIGLVMEFKAWMYFKVLSAFLLLCWLRIFVAASGRCREGSAIWFMNPASGVSRAEAFSPQQSLQIHKYFAKSYSRASLVAQWLRVCLPMQGTRVRALVWEDPTCRGATGPLSHDCWACASGACAP